MLLFICSNNTNKLSPQERSAKVDIVTSVQIIQINLVLKNKRILSSEFHAVQIIQINLVLKNGTTDTDFSSKFK